MKFNILKEWTTKSGHKAYLVLYLNHINGYVAPNKSELKSKELNYYKSNYNIENLPSKKIANIQKQINNIEVHGGLTYYDNTLFNEYVFGFDTAHCGDKGNYEFAIKNTPNITKKEKEKLKEIDILDKKYPILGRIWRDPKYCENQCEILSEQIKKIEDNL